MSRTALPVLFRNALSTRTALPKEIVKSTGAKLSASVRHRTSAPQDSAWYKRIKMILSSTTEDNKDLQDALNHHKLFLGSKNPSTTELIDRLFVKILEDTITNTDNVRISKQLLDLLDRKGRSVQEEDLLAELEQIAKRIKTENEIKRNLPKLTPQELEELLQQFQQKASKNKPQQENPSRQQRRNLSTSTTTQGRRLRTLKPQEEPTKLPDHGERYPSRRDLFAGRKATQETSSKLPEEPSRTSLRRTRSERLESNEQTTQR